MDGFQDKEFMSNNDLELDKQSERMLDDLAANELASDETCEEHQKNRTLRMHRMQLQKCNTLSVDQ